jgi:hypothetical protein
MELVYIPQVLEIYGVQNKPDWLGRAITHAVSHRLPTEAARV